MIYELSYFFFLSENNWNSDLIWIKIWKILIWIELRLSIRLSWTIEVDECFWVYDIWHMIRKEKKIWLASKKYNTRIVSWLWLRTLAMMSLCNCYWSTKYSISFKTLLDIRNSKILDNWNNWDNWHKEKEINSYIIIHYHFYFVHNLMMLYIIKWLILIFIGYTYLENIETVINWRFLR